MVLIPQNNRVMKVSVPLRGKGRDQLRHVSSKFVEDPLVSVPLRGKGRDQLHIGASVECKPNYGFRPLAGKR